MNTESPGSLIGSVIASYRILARVGEGGMGQVYMAEHIKMKRKSAIKVMRPALVDDHEALQRFTREAENASKLSHPNVASIFDFGETDDGLVFLAMEFIEGESLHATLEREKALHPLVAADIVGQAADALQAAHDAGILHRDLKPDNLMLSKRTDGTYLVKLVDFGIARTMDNSTTRVTRTGFAVGTPEYMSPEQLAGDVLDARSDQYALALVAFAALTGEEAFSSVNAKDTLILRLTSRPRRLAEVRTDIDWPVSLQSVFDRALAPESNDRFPHISEFADELAAAINVMTPTQTSEMYTRALQGRGMGASRLTPGSNAHVPAQPRATEKATAASTSAARGVPVAKPIGMPGKRKRFLPTVFVLGLFLYGLHWYGAKQPSGAARDISDVIGSISQKVAAPVLPYIDRMRNAATPADSSRAVATPTPRKRPVKAKSDSTAKDTARRDTTAAVVPPDSVIPPA